MAATSTDIVNEALQLFGDDGPKVTGVAPSFDSSAAGKAAAAVYTSTVAAVARQFSWDFARQNATLSLSGNTAPFPWAFEYVYPSNAIQIWQLAPISLADANDPQPVTWAVGNSVVGGNQVKVIWSNLSHALAIFNGNPAEATWDSLFREAVTRLLASKLAMALAGKPDTAQGLLETVGAFQGVATERDS
jgi:hypothetical protein